MTGLKLKFELLWLLITALLLSIVLLPIQKNIPVYPFWTSNIVFIVVFATLFRLIFFLKHSLIAKLQYLKIALVLAMIPLVFYMIGEINYFQTYLDERGVDTFLGHLNDPKQTFMDNYIRSEMLFFGTAAVISAMIIPFRLVISVWRTRNRGTA